MKCYHCGTQVEVDRVVPINSVVLCGPCADKARVKCRDCGAPIIADNHVTIGHPDVNGGEPFSLCGPCAAAKAKSLEGHPDLTDEDKELIATVKQMVD